MMHANVAKTFTTDAFAPGRGAPSAPAGTLVGDVLARLSSQGVTFNADSITCLRQLKDEAAQVAVLQRVQDYLRDPSALLIHVLQDQLQDRLSTATVSHETTHVAVQALFQERSRPPYCGLGSEPLGGHRVGQSRPSGLACELSKIATTFASDGTTFEHCTSMPSVLAGGTIAQHSDMSGLPPTQYMMCQKELDIFRCPSVASSCVSGASRPHEVEHALSLCNSDLAYLTVSGIRDVESFPWKLPAGWYALHVVQRDLTESLREKVARSRIPIPENLPTSCIIAVIKLGVSKPSRAFNGDPWALGQWCQAVEEVMMLQSCVPVSMEELRRLWVLPDQVRLEIQACILRDRHPIPDARLAPKNVVLRSVRTVGLAGVSHDRQSDQAMLLGVSTPLRSSSEGNLVLEADRQQALGSKKPRIYFFLHASFPQQAPPHVDRLQRLYPHPRDHDCYLDDKLHKYSVHGESYSLSVSGWWKMFFDDFDPKLTSECIVQRQLECPGFRPAPSEEAARIIFASSVYNFAQHMRIFEKRDDNEFLQELRKVALDAQDDYARRGTCCPLDVEHAMMIGRDFLLDPRKPQGPSCYYLTLLYTSGCGPEVQATQIAQTWDIFGSLESLKGTYLHKKIELFINAMARPMERDGTTHIAVQDLLREEPPANEFCAEAVMRQIAWAQDPELWNHPLAQRFFEEEMRGESLEFQKFRAWLSTKPRWTPMRLEWSLYNEDLKVAGQIDSLWMDLDSGGSWVLADWKRARELLTDDPVELDRQSHGKRGTSCCSHLPDTAYSHYFVQQTLYAYLLASKYEISVERMMLVQCHPHVCDANFNEAPLIADFELADSLARVLQSRLASSG